jgi:arylformamidase
MSFGGLRLDQSWDISIPVRFTEPTVEAWGLPAPTQQAVEAGSFVGDVARGGSANCRELRVIPHTAGTHTECVGHIVSDPVTIRSVHRRPLSYALLLTVPAQPLGESGERYSGEFAGDDRVITAQELAAALRNLHSRHGWGTRRIPTALVIRTQDGPSDLQSRRWTDSNPPYLTLEAVEWVKSFGALDLLLDVPSIDREWDGGTLPAHHAWWDVEPGARTLSGPPSPRTLTEFVSVPAALYDGLYALLLQVPAIESDAAPSRPVLVALADSGTPTVDIEIRHV